MEGVGRTLGHEDEHSVRELPRLLGLDAAALPHLSKMPVKYAEKKKSKYAPNMTKSGQIPLNFSQISYQQFCSVSAVEGDLVEGCLVRVGVLCAPRE